MLSLVSSKLTRTLGAKRLKNTALLISGVGGDFHSPHQVEFMLNSLRCTESISAITSVAESAILVVDLLHIKICRASKI